ncbi:MAG: hypothetical protein WCI89_00195 [bacterium]
MNRLVMILLCFVLVGYAAFETRRLAIGPQITITFPQEGGQTASTTVTVTGVVENIAFFTINDAPAHTDQSGHFSLTFAPPPGYNTLTVAASDRFGRRTSKTVAFTLLTYCPA